VKLSHKAFPYPVLRAETDDYVDVEFKADLKITLEDGETEQMLHINGGYTLTEPSIEQQIERGSARALLDIENTATLFRKAYTLRPSDTDIKIPVSEFDQTLEITPFIVAEKNISDFSSASLNPEFGAMAFEFKPGDMIAFDFTIIKNFEFSSLSFENLLKISTSPDVDDFCYEIDASGSIINVHMGKKCYEIWRNKYSDTQNRPFLAMSIYKDAVFAALDRMLNGEDEGNDGIRWMSTLKTKLANLGINPEADADFNQINGYAQLLTTEQGIRRLLDHD
jgi:hypothetical protein